MPKPILSGFDYSEPVGPLIVDIPSTTLSSEDKQLLSSRLVGGVILFTRNYQSPSQIKSLVEAIRTQRSDIIVAIDHEGGRVQRFKTGFTLIPPMQTLGKLYRHEPDRALSVARETGWVLASELLAIDIDISFAPVLDVDENLSDIIGDRAFSADPNLVVKLAEAFIDGMHEAGMAVTGKHFPGHGGVKADSHLELPRDERTLAQLQQRDLIPFTKLLPKLDALMPAHIIFPEVDLQPVGFSKTWIMSILREQMGYNGLIVSDDLSMQGAAIAGDHETRAQNALNAGCDAIIICNNRPAVISVIEKLAPWEPLTNTPNLAAMRAKIQVDGQQLVQSDRWHSATAAINRLHFLT